MLRSIVPLGIVNTGECDKMFNKRAQSFCLLGILLLVLVSAYTLADGKGALNPHTIAGTVAYRERIALAPESIVNVALVEVTAGGHVVIAEDVVRPQRQVPIPFTLEFDQRLLDEARDYAVKAEILSKDKVVMWSLLTPVSLEELGSEDLELMLVKGMGEEPSVEAALALPGHTFTDGEVEFTAYFEEGKVYLILPGSEMVILPQVRAASGAKYTDGITVFWNKGNQAFIEFQGKNFQTHSADTHLSPWEKAKAAGVDFRGLGQEPGWVVEIREGKTITFIGDYGDVKINVYVPEADFEPQTGGKRYTGASGVGTVEVTVWEEPHTDIMSGQVFPFSVTVAVGGRTYYGGGRWLNSVD